MRSVLLPLILSLTAPAVGVVQVVTYGQKVVEVIGLKKRTPADLQNALRQLDSTLTLESAACAVLLRDSLGFADAAATSVTFRDTSWLVLTVVEPEDARLVQFRRPAADTGSTPSSWNPLSAALESDPAAVSPLQDYRFLVGTSDSAFGHIAPPPSLALRDRVRARRSRPDWLAARTVILQDASVQHRAAAALVLSNFPARDSTWYVLAEGLRTIPDVATSMTELVLTALARSDSFVVDWAPARTTLAALLGGTTLFAYPKLLEALVATRIDPVLGTELARVNPDLLLSHAGARNPLSRAAGQRFLRHISGQDFGADVQKWKDWLTHGTRSNPRLDTDGRSNGERPLDGWRRRAR